MLECGKVIHRGPTRGLQYFWNRGVTNPEEDLNLILTEAVVTWGFGENNDLLKLIKHLSGRALGLNLAVPNMIIRTVIRVSWEGTLEHPWQ